MYLCAAQLESELQGKILHDTEKIRCAANIINKFVTWQEKGTTEDEMAGWHHGLDGHESE